MRWAFFIDANLEPRTAELRPDLDQVRDAIAETATDLQTAFTTES